MYTMNQLTNDIRDTKRLIQRAQTELNAGREIMPDWKIDALQEVIDDGVDALDDLYELRRKNLEDWHFARGECPDCQTKSDMPGSYCTNCQQTAAEIRANVQ